MKREHFVSVVEEVLDSLPQEFRSRIRNAAVLVEDVPPNQPSPQEEQRRLLLGLFHDVPTPPRRPYVTYLRGPIALCVILTAKEL
jgi:predicted Zn-dependent protease with MMP-like domain